MDRLKEILSKNEQELLKLDHVLGVGIGFKEIQGRVSTTLGLKICVNQKLPKGEIRAGHLVPEMLEEVPTDVITVGKLAAYPGSSEDLIDRGQKHRPARPGTSIGHYRVSYGTFGAVVKDRFTGKLLILSNNHILANVTNGQDGRSTVGDPILQPGTDDGGELADTIGYLERFVPLNYGSDASNLVDAAVARPIDPGLIDPRILGLGAPRETIDPQIGQVVYKSGRGTGLTRGWLRVIHTSILMEYADGLSARLTDQVVTSKMAGPGDSGALLLDTNRRAIGLLVGGSEQAVIYSLIGQIFRLLQIKF
ncbi:MAG: chymotrypsin family serine protease [Bacillota bacterium]